MVRKWFWKWFGLHLKMEKKKVAGNGNTNGETGNGKKMLRAFSTFTKYMYIFEFF